MIMKNTFFGACTFSRSRDLAYAVALRFFRSEFADRQIFRTMT
jgi:hypothetical protein